MTCPDCGLSPAGQAKETTLRAEGWTVAHISDMGLMDD